MHRAISGGNHYLNRCAQFNFRMIFIFFLTFISFANIQETLNEMHHNAPQAAVDVLEKIASFGYAIESSSLALTAAASTQLGQALFDFPCHNLKSIAKMIESNPAMCAATAIQRLYPHRVFPTSSSHSAVTTLADALKITDEHNKRQRIIGVERLQSSVTETATSEKNQLCNGTTFDRKLAKLSTMIYQFNFLILSHTNQ